MFRRVFKMNLPTSVILAIILYLFIRIVAGEIKKKKEGKTSCGCGCSGCAMADKCHAEKRGLR